MALITAGPGAIDRAASDGPNYTTIDINPATAASGTGRLTTYKIWATTPNANGAAKLGVFFRVSGNNYTCRAYASVTITGSGLKTFAVDLPVVAGDFLGFYTTAYTWDRVVSGSSVYVANDHMDAVNLGFTGYVTTCSIEASGTTVPNITSLTENHGHVGQSMVIAGSNFDPAQGGGGVTINGVAATVTAWADNSITVTIPVGATSGNVIVTNSTGGVSAGAAWTLDPDPAITSLTPDTGSVGQSVVIGGTNFGAVQGTGTVTLNGTACTVTAWSNISITIVVPVGATSGNIVVTADDGAVSNGMPFTVTAPTGGGSSPSVGRGPVSAGAVVCNPPVWG